MTDGERLEEIVETPEMTPDQLTPADTLRAPDETGMPAVCDEVITTARTAG